MMATQSDTTTLHDRSRGSQADRSALLLTQRLVYLWSFVLLACMLTRPLAKLLQRSAKALSKVGLTLFEPLICSNYH
jgi:hypothetical protein